MAKEYIERESVWQKIFNHCEVCVKLHNAADCNDCILDELKDELYEIPAADVRPVVHARWVLDADGVDMCSNCEANALQRMRFNAQGWTWTCPTVRTMFCPYCGARMDGADMREVDDED